MHLLKSKTANWANRIRALLQQSKNGQKATSRNIVTTKSPKASKGKDVLGSSSESDYTSTFVMPNVHTRQLSTKPSPSRKTRNEKSSKLSIKPTEHPTPFSRINPFALSGNGHDLRRFLEEIGTDPKEARYWLKQFQQSTEPYSPFAVVQVDSEVFSDQDMLDSLGSCLSFLHRNNMKCIVIHGANTPEPEDLPLDMQVLRTELCSESMMLVSALESHGVMARPFFMGNSIFEADSADSHNNIGMLQDINTDPIVWALHTGHIPVLQSMGETATGNIVSMDVCKVTAEVAKVLQPRKVLFVNTTGGFVDDRGEPIPNVNLPNHWEASPDEIKWSDNANDRVNLIGDMLAHLPQHSSVVITSATTLLTELFTHHGSGTFFKITEPIHKYQSLKHVNHTRLRMLINKSFGKDLTDNYFESLEQKVHTLYVSEDYNAAAIIITEKGQQVPYLDKFAVGQAKQGEGTGEMLWTCIQSDFPQLFWRSRTTNRINPWYFKRCDGLWSNNSEWMIFWYGVTSHKDTSGLIDFALNLPTSFGDSGKLMPVENGPCKNLF